MTRPPTPYPPAPTPPTPAEALDALQARLPLLALARYPYTPFALDADAEQQYEVVTALLELLRRVSELERRERERDGDRR